MSDLQEFSNAQTSHNGMDEIPRDGRRGKKMNFKYVKPLFIGQIEDEKTTTEYDAGIVCKRDGNYLIGYEMQGAEETFSIGQPVYDKDGNVMGWLGIGLFESLNYSAEVRVPCEYWQICLPTKHCEVGKKVYTYWQKVESEE